MIIEDITLSGNNEVKLKDIPFVGLCRVKAQSLSQIGTFIKSCPDREWLDRATHEASKLMENDTSILIRETERELKKAKALLKKHHPIKYRLSFYRVIITNPIKSILWLLMSK